MKNHLRLTLDCRHLGAWRAINARNNHAREETETGDIDQVPPRFISRAWLITVVHSAMEFGRFVVKLRSSVQAFRDVETRESEEETEDLPRSID